MRRFAEVFILTALVASGCTVAWVSAHPAPEEQVAPAPDTLADATPQQSGVIANR